MWPRTRPREPPPHLLGPLNRQRPLGCLVQAVQDSPRRPLDPTLTQACTPAPPRASPAPRSDTGGRARWHSSGCRRAQPPLPAPALCLPSPLSPRDPQAPPSARAPPLLVSGAPPASPGGRRVSARDPQLWSARSLRPPPRPRLHGGRAAAPSASTAPPHASPGPALRPRPHPSGCRLRRTWWLSIQRSAGWRRRRVPPSITVPAAPMGLFCPSAAAPRPSRTPPQPSPAPQRVSPEPVSPPTPPGAHALRPPLLRGAGTGPVAPGEIGGLALDEESVEAHVVQARGHLLGRRLEGPAHEKGAPVLPAGAGAPRPPRV